MLSKLRSRLTYANVMATIAVFVALGGSSYAAAHIGSKQIVDNSVRSQDIRNNDVRGKDIRTGTIRSSDVGNGSLLAQDFAPGQLPAGPRGPKGDKGNKGDQGSVGPTQGFSEPGLSGAVPPATQGTKFSETNVTTIADGRLFVFNRGQILVNCTAGTTARLGLYVDGTAASGSGRLVGTGQPTEIGLFGLSDSVSAGTHNVALAATCDQGSVAAGSFYGGDGALGGILVGS
jgi:hypothetical protein